MTKKEIQKRVLQNGKPLPLRKFEWNEETNTFSSKECDLIIDFREIDNAIIECGSFVTIDCGEFVTINCGGLATIDCGAYATINCSNFSIIKCGDSATIKCGRCTTIDCGNSTMIDCEGDECVIVRRDIYEVIEPKRGQTIKTREFSVRGYEVID